MLLTRHANPVFCRLVGNMGVEIVGRPFADAAPEGEERVAGNA